MVAIETTRQVLGLKELKEIEKNINRHMKNQI
jgi:hypothetical protein